MMVLQYSSVNKSLHWNVITMTLFNANVGILPVGLSQLCFENFQLRF